VALSALVAVYPTNGALHFLRFRKET
jgi:hypothetical protein